MTIEEMIGGLGPGQYVEPSPFASARHVRLFWVREKSHHSDDFKVGLVITQNNKAVFVPDVDLAVLQDILVGIVKRGNLS